MQSDTEYHKEGTKVHRVFINHLDNVIHQYLTHLATLANRQTGDPATWHSGHLGIPANRAPFQSKYFIFAHHLYS